MSNSFSIYPSKPWNWSGDISNSNFLRPSYINGNLDISGQTICRTDASMGGNLAVSGGISVSNSISVSNNIGMSGIINQMSMVPLSGGFVYQPVYPANLNTVIAQVATLNLSVVAQTTSNYGTNVTIGNLQTSTNTVLAGPYNYIAGNIVGQYDTNLNGNLIVGGNTQLNGNVSISGNLTTNYDVSINNMVVGSGKSDITTNTLVGGGGALQSTGSSSLQNTAIGYSALNSISSGGANTAIGYLAGSLASGTNATSSNMTFLGASTGTNAVGSAYSYSTAVGYGALVNGSNQVVLGRSTEKTIISGDASLNGRLVLQSDASMGGNVTIGGNIVLAGFSTFTSDVSLNKRLFVFSDLSMGGNIIIGGNIVQAGFATFTSDVSLNKRLFVSSDASFGGNINIIGNTVQAGFATFTSDVSMNKRLFVLSDLSMGGNIIIGGNIVQAGFATFISDVSLNKRLFVSSDAYFGGNINIIGNTVQAGFATFTSYVSMNKRLFVSSDASFGGNINIIGNTVHTGFSTFTSDVSMSKRLFVSSDASFGGNLIIGGNLTVFGGSIINSNIINTTVTNYQLVITDDISLNGRLIASSDVSLGGKLITSTINNNSGVNVQYAGTTVLSTTSTGVTITGALTTGSGAISSGAITAPSLNYSTGLNLQYNGTTALSTTSGGNVTIPNYLTTTNDAQIHGLTVGLGAGSITTNTAIGISALPVNTTGSNNTAIGVQALQTNQTGSSNTALGIAALMSSTTSSNTAVGAGSLQYMTSSNNNTGLGASAGIYVNGSQNTAIGSNAMIGVSGSTTGTNNSAIGYTALYSITTGNYNCALGSAALYSNTTSSNNTAIGNQALYSITGNGNNTAIGYQTLYYNTGNRNTAIGMQSMQGVSGSSTGGSNTAVGFQSLYSLTTGTLNTALGYESLYSSSTGSNNVGIGYYALYNITTTSNNTAIGHQAGYNIIGNSNTTVGYQALMGTTSSNSGSNCAFGYQSLTNITSASNNSAFGNKSGSAITSGASNCLIGCQAGTALTTGSSNSALGYQAFYTGTTYNNSTAIGYSSQPTASNQVMLGTTAETVVCPNTLAIGKTTIGTTYVGNSSAGIYTTYAIDVSSVVHIGPNNVFGNGPYIPYVSTPNLIIDTSGVFDGSFASISGNYCTGISVPMLSFTKNPAGSGSTSYWNQTAALSLGRFNNSTVTSNSKLDIVLSNQANDLNQVMTIQSNGNVGINTAYPNSSLDVTGTVAINAYTPTTTTMSSASWATPSGIAGNVTVTAVSMSNTGQNAIASSASGLAGIWYSTNYGSTWSQAYNGGTSNLTGGGFQSISLSLNSQYAVAVSATGNGGAVWYSSNFGYSWFSAPTVTSGFTNAIVSANGMNMYAVGSSKGLYYSSNFGQTWSQMTAVTNYSITGTYSSLAMSNFGWTYIMIIGGSSSNPGIFVSNYIGNWTTTNITTGAWNSVACSFTSGQYAIAGSAGTSGIYYSSNYGSTFTVSNITTGSWNVSMCTSGQFCVAAGYNGTVGVYYSTNYGQTWTITTLSTGLWYGIAMSGTGQYTLAGSYASIGISLMTAVTQNSLIVNSSGNVGVGTASPGVLFDVSGQIRTNNTLTINSSTTNILPLSITSYGTDTYSTAATSSSSRLAYSVPGLCVQCTTYPNATNQSFLFDVTCYNSTNGACGVYFGGIPTTGGANSAGQFVIGRRTGATNWNESVRVDNNGYVGLGTSSPSYNLDISGTYRATGAGIISGNVSTAQYPLTSLAMLPTGGYNNVPSSITMGGTFYNYSGDTNPRTASIIKSGFASTYTTWGGEYLSFSVGNNGNTNDSGTSTIERLRITGNNGYVGIGTTTPSYPLHIVGYAASTSASKTGYFYNGNSTSTLNTNLSASSNASLAVSNDIIAYGGIFAVASIAASDIRIKSNIHPLDGNEARSILQQLKPTTYNYIDQMIHGSLPVYGFIAQDVNKVIKSCIKLRKDFIPNIYEIVTITNDNIITLNTKTTEIFGADTNGFDCSGNSIKLKLYDTSNNEIFTTITKIIDNKSFQISTTLNMPSAFAFGQEVDDFYGLDKDAIFTVTTAAVQTIDTIVQSQQETIKTLQIQNTKLEERLAAIEARLLAANIV
jgi:predicted acyltransferase (DUF342 family)